MKAILFLILLFVGTTLHSQLYVGPTIAPQKRGIGVISMYDVKNFSFYASYDIGWYKNEFSDVIKITKYGGGVAYKKVMTGLMYNSTMADIHKYSLEVGFKDKLFKTVYFSMLYDVMNYEPRIGIYFKIN